MMASNKIRIIFNAGILADSLVKNTARTGIYFTAYNIFDNIRKRGDFDLLLYSSRRWRLRRYLAKYFPSCAGLPVISDIAKAPAADAFFSAGDPIDKSVSVSIPGISCYSIIYDIIPAIHPEYFNISQSPAVWEMLNNFEAVDHYFAISESTKNDVVRMGAAIDPRRITVVPLGANVHFHQNRDVNTSNAVREKYKIPVGKKYILSLCTKEPRKNLLTAIRAFIECVDKNGIDDLIYVLAGGTWNIFKEALETCLGGLNRHAAAIVSIGYVDDEDLASLYSNAQWFVYTSHYEGFGLPPLEAMQCGCPVVTSNNSSLPEVVGDAGLMVDSHDFAQHVKAFEDYYFKPELRQENSRKGLERAKLFSWERCTDIICDRIIADAEKKRNTPPASVVIMANSLESSEDAAAILQRVESVRTQRYPNKEVLIMDCGADSSISEQLRIFATESDIPLAAAAGVPACRALTSALKAVAGKYVAFLSPGMHYIDDGYLAVCIAKCEEFDADFSYSDCELNAGGRNGVWRGNIENIPFGEHFCGGSALLRRNALEQIGGFSAEYGSAIFDEMIMRMLREKKSGIHVFSMRTRLNAAFSSKRRDGRYAKAYYDVFGKDLQISLTEALELSYIDEYLKNHSDHEISELAAKLPVHGGGMALFEKLFKSRHAAQFMNETRRGELSESRQLLFGFLPLTVQYSGTAILNRVVYSLPGGIPFLKVVRRESARASYYLFNFLPLFRTKRKS